ncbi:hypothetical protein BaRGS_00015189, partial [Batillaria attramentaria]
IAKPGGMVNSVNATTDVELMTKGKGRATRTQDDVRLLSFHTWSGDYSVHNCCKAGYWGDQCDNTCYRGCVNGTCNKDDGQCQCAPGWRVPCDACDDHHYGDDCDRECGNCTDGAPCDKRTGHCPSLCPEKTYGQNCSTNCGPCADDVTCHPVTGSCPDRCGPGYLGQRCDAECPKGQYGQNCSESCGNCHNTTTCDHVDGHCPDRCRGNFSVPLCQGCVDGWYGDQCQTECSQNCSPLKCDQDDGGCEGCEAGYWGDQCDKTCNRGCVDGTCNRDDGQCQCAPGWREPSCAACPVRKYGQNCALSCGHCADNVTCDHVDGHCPDGCGSGYLGELCDIECAKGRYGQNCSELCGNCHNKAICDHVTGHCPQGCPGNFSTTLCKVCVAGLWGENCTESCGQCAGDGSCDRMTAECSAGCVAGWNGTVCQQKGCVDGWYGDQCRTECSQNCSPLKCDQDDGGCEGCKAGYWGDQCDKTCSRGCVNGTCNRDDGQCQCAPGWRVPCDGEQIRVTIITTVMTVTENVAIVLMVPRVTRELATVLHVNPAITRLCAKTDVACHPVTGSCPDGCGPGYLGQRCDAECPKGQYGQNCSESCGNCHNTTTCDHVNGHCPDRCRGNFSVPLCQAGVENFLNQTTFMTNQTVVENVVQDLSQVMDQLSQVMDQLRQDNVGQRLLNVIERVSREGALSDGQLTATSPNLVISARAVDSRNFSGLTFTAFAGEDNHFQDGEVQAYSRTSVPETSDDISSLVLPANLLTSLGNVSRIATTVHVDGRLFEAIAPPPDTNGSDVDHVRKVNSYVMSASVVGHDEVMNLQDPIVLGLVHVNKSSFLIRIQRMNTSSKILVSLCVALALSDLVFVVGMQDYTLKHPAACKAVSMLLHFCLLSSMCWMLMEAFYLYLSFVRIFRTISTDIILKFSCFAWGVPVLIVVITAGVSTADSYSPLDSGICWLTGTAFYAAFVGPVCLILLLNLVSFVLVLRVILGLTDKQETSQAAQKLRRAIGVVVLLGLTWVFGLLSIEDTSQIVFNYLFAVFNSLQGLFIFLFYCVFNKNTRAIWQRCFRTCVTSRPAGDVFLVTTTSDNTRSTDPVAATSSSV